MDRRLFIKSLTVASVFSILPSGQLNAGDKAYPGSSAQEEHLKGRPFDIAVTQDNLLVVSYIGLSPPDYKILICDADGNTIRSFGEPGSKEGFLNFPRGVTCDLDGNVLVVDSNNCRVQKFSPNGDFLDSLGSVGSIGGAFATPQGIFADKNKKLLIADTRNHRIQIFENRNLTAIVGELGDSDDQFRLPTACVVDTTGQLLVLDSKHGKVKVFGQDLKYLKSYSSQGDRPGQLNLPQGMVIDEQDNVWIADTGNNRIQVFDPTGQFMGDLSQKVTLAYEWDQPTGIAVKEERIFVTNYGTGHIKAISLT